MAILTGNKLKLITMSDLPRSIAFPTVRALWGRLDGILLQVGGAHPRLTVADIYATSSLGV
jgi:hypothetical protein